jgi:signal transduction histidine kinase
MIAYTSSYLQDCFVCSESSMSSGFEAPRVRRRTVTLTHDKVLKEVPSSDEVRIIRAVQPQQQASARREPTAAPKTNTTTPSKTNSLGGSPSSSYEATVQTGATVLVVNASQETAQEITLELSRTLPGCSILFAPTLQLALWILKRRSIDIILSSAVLPDGPLSRLHESLECLSSPPELVILSDLTTTRAELGSHPGYRFVELRRVQSHTPYAPAPVNAHVTQISSLGADIRNDLNNPLQEIVAMAFVATSSDGLSPIAEEALSAIQRAATNMSSVVNSLEDKIRSVVEQPRMILTAERQGKRR